MSTWCVLEGDCRHVLPGLPARSVDAVVTSPPYAQQRKGTYGGVSEEQYAEWTCSWFDALRRVLKPSGSVLFVIRPHVAHGVISDYMLRTRLALRAADWRELDEFIWRKPDAPPMGHIGRPRRSWESLHWFATTTNPYCDSKANGVPSDRVGGLMGGRGVSHGWQHISGSQAAHEPGVARCADVVDISVRHNVDDSEDTRHPAPYPMHLAIWAIRLICPEGGTVLDPFCGSGSTGVAALRQGRKFVGVEMDPAYAAMSRARIRADAPLFNIAQEAA